MKPRIFFYAVWWVEWNGYRYSNANFKAVYDKAAHIWEHS